MAIQQRRGAYADFNPSKLLPGEPAVVQSGDPNSTDGSGVYVSINSGNVKRLVTADELETAVNAVAEDLVATLNDTVSTFVNTTAPNAVSAVTAEGATQVSAVEDKGAEVLESIPQDYTELSDTVDDLKDAIGNGVAVSADQLISDNYTEDRVPYLYRTSGGDGADRAYDTIVGGSVVWNQTFNYDSTTLNVANLTITKEGNGVYRFNGTRETASSGNIGSQRQANHVYYFTSGRSQNDIVLSNSSSWSNKSDYLVKPANAMYANLLVNVGTYTNADFKPQIFDLTQMFGSTIADHLYSLEQSSAGSGIAKLKSWGFMQKDYYPYNAGELMHVSGLQSHDTTGFNQFKVAPAYFTNGANSTILDKTKAVKVIKGEQYQFTFDEIGTATNWRYILKLWDMNEEFVTTSPRDHLFDVNSGSPTYNASVKGYVDGANGTGKERIYTFKSDFYVLFEFGSGNTSSSMQMKNPCLHLIRSGDRNGQYEPYKKNSYPLDSSLTLRGIPKLDASNQLYFNGDTYASDGTVTRKMTEIEVTSGISFGTASTGFPYVQLSGVAATVFESSLNNFLSDRYSFRINAPDINSGRWFRVTSTNLFIFDERFTDLETANSILATEKPKFVYELATPTSETADPYTNPQIVDPYGTEEYVTTSIVPVGHITKYPENLRAKIEGLPWDLSMIAPIDNGTTATRVYSTGQYFLHNDQFCKAKTSIASGATFTLDTNYEVTTVAAELYAALH